MAYFLQVLGAVFIISMLYLTYVHLKRKEFDIKDFSWWGATWVLLGIFIIFPDVTETIFVPLRVHGALQFIILFSLAILFLFTFKNFQSNRKNQQKINSLISSIAMQNEKKNNDR